MAEGAIRIPYRNIARVKASQIKKAVGVGLHDPNDPDTHIASAEGRHRVSVGVLYHLPGGWQINIQEVAERLKRRCQNLGER
jgi:hypothetical protein